MFIDNKQWTTFGGCKTRHLAYQGSNFGPWYSICGKRGETKHDEDNLCEECEKILVENKLR